MTVLSHFQKAILRFRCPLKIQSDYGTENMDVLRWILNHHDVHTKNRFLMVFEYTINTSKDYGWRSEFMFCNNLHFNLFRFYENISVLDPVNEKHLFSLHNVSPPLINTTLEQFMETWSSHLMRTCANMSPLQIWTEGFTDENFRMWDHLGWL